MKSRLLIISSVILLMMPFSEVYAGALIGPIHYSVEYSIALTIFVFSIFTIIVITLLLQRKKK